ncbi:MAG TPA: type II toxin-antitoxin system RelE/ParE family toxin [Sphingomonas sp.]|nr:type II toxin-antitoxin system RelE/ParE family toxin [Sphingomonas sp.]
MAVKFTPQARDDLAAIRDWIARDDVLAAERGVGRLVQTTIIIGEFPHMGRNGLVSGTREFTVAGLPYLVVYAVVAEANVDILAFLHTRRRYP